MPKTVLIILAAVVVLIVFVVLTGMRYLRAEDEDDFDDDIPAEHGRSRSHGSYPSAEQARLRQRHLDDRADDRHRERVGAARAARSFDGRDERGVSRRSPDQRGPGHRPDERSWRGETGRTAGPEVPGRNSRSASADRDQRPARGGWRDRDISEPMTAMPRSRRPVPARGASAGGDDYESQPGRRAPGYDRDPRDGRDRRDARSSRLAEMDDDHAARRDSREPSRDRRARGDGRVSRDRSDHRDGRPSASLRDDSDRDERDRRSVRPNARPDARKNESAPDEDLLPAIKPRQSRGKRDGEGDWPSNEWDELSDVDFWAELASDKPFTAKESAEPARTERRGPRSDRDPRPDRSAKPERAVRQDRDAHVERDGRADRRDARSDPVGKQLSRQGRELDSGSLPSARARDPQSDWPAMPRPVIDDDDPLTSPSFPRISAEDSRSYRKSRPAADPRRASGRMPADQPSYPAMPRVEPVRGIDGASNTRRHSLPAASGAELTDGYSAPAASQSPGGDPYGSPSAGGAGLAPYQAPPATSYASGGATASYSVPAHPVSYQVPGEAPYGGSGVYQAAGVYLPSAGNRDGFAAETGANGYQSLPPAPEPYRPDPAPGGYQGASGYSLPPSYGAGPGDLANGYQANGYQPASYQGYGGAASASGLNQRPEPGYPGGGYRGGSEHSLAAPLPAAQPEVGYQPNPAPVPASQNSYDAAPYQPAGYDPAGYHLPAGDANGYAGADPYAVDPYGQHGYGGTGY